MAEPSPDVEGRLYRAESWIERATSGCRPEDFDARFIYLWIAFNALYGQAKYKEEDRQGEEASIHEFLGKMGRLSSAGELRTAVGRLECGFRRS